MMKRISRAKRAPTRQSLGQCAPTKILAQLVRRVQVITIAISTPSEYSTDCVKELIVVVVVGSEDNGNCLR